MTDGEKSDRVYDICMYMWENHGNNFTVRDDLQVVVSESPYDTNLSLQTYDEFLEGLEDFFDDE